MQRKKSQLSYFLMELEVTETSVVDFVENSLLKDLLCLVWSTMMALTPIILMKKKRKVSNTDLKTWKTSVSGNLVLNNERER